MQPEFYPKAVPSLWGLWVRAASWDGLVLSELGLAASAVYCIGGIETSIETGTMDEAFGTTRAEFLASRAAITVTCVLNNTNVAASFPRMPPIHLLHPFS